MSAPAPPSVATRLADATRWKEEGNAKMTEKDYSGAVAAYKKVFLYTRGLDVGKSELSMYSSSLGKEAPTAEQEGQVGGLVVAVCSNLALAYMHLENYERAVQYGKQGLDLQPQYLKLLIRVGQAYHRLGDLSKADEYLTAAAKHPECSGGVSKQVREELVAVRLALKAKEDAFGRGFSAAFSGGGATGAT